MQFADLPTDGGFAFLATDGSQLLQRLHQTEGGLIDDKGLIQRGEVLQPRLTSFLLRQEPFEIEVVVW